MFKVGYFVFEVVLFYKREKFFLVSPWAASDEGKGCFWIFLEDGGRCLEEEERSFSFCVWTDEEDFVVGVFVCRWLDIKFFCVNASVDNFYFLRGKTASFLDNIANKVGVWNDFCALS